MMDQFIISVHGDRVYLCVDYYDTFGPKMWEVIKELENL